MGELPSLSGSPFPGVTLLPGSHERWVSRVVRNTGHRVQLHFLVLTLIVTGLNSSGKFFDISLPDGLGMRNKKDFTLLDYWADQM